MFRCGSLAGLGVGSVHESRMCSRFASCEIETHTGWRLQGNALIDREANVLSAIRKLPGTGESSGLPRGEKVDLNPVWH